MNSTEPLSQTRKSALFRSGNLEDHRARLSEAGRALQPRSIGPPANVIRRIEIRVDASSPRPLGVVEHRDFELEGFPIRVDYDVQNQRVSQEANRRRQRMRFVAPVG